MPRRAALAGAVLAAHGLLLLGWTPPSPQRLSAERVVQLRLLPPDRVEPPPAAPARIAPSQAPRAARAPARATVPAGVTVDPAIRPDEPPAITAPPAAAVASAPPLRLALPPGARASGPRSLREQMLRDPRANSRPTRDATQALQGLGDPGPRLAEETMDGEGRRRVRIGRNCVEVHEPRMAQLDPHNRSTTPMPSQLRGCN